MKRIVPAACLSLLFLTSFSGISDAKFSYRYEIRASSSSVKDQMMLYTYKKFLIETYEDLCFKAPESIHDQIIRENLFKFKIDMKASAKLSFGTLVLIVGPGVGPSLKGDLRKNACDFEVIDTRFFFYDLFSR